MAHLGPGYPTGCDPTLVTAAHEVGHGITAWAAGFTVHYIHLKFSLFGEISGITKLKEEKFPKSQVAAYAVYCLGGFEAEAQYLARNHGLSLSQARKLADGPLKEGNDWDGFKGAAKFAGLSHSDAFRRVEKLVAKHERKSAKLIDKLARTNKLTGKDF